MFECKRLSYRYPTAEHPAVGPIDMSMEAGQLIVISGPTGCGKSTLLRLMAGILQRHGQGESGGSVRIDGEDPVEWAPAVRAQRLGFVSQCPGDQIVSGSIWGELTFGMDSAGIPDEHMATSSSNWLKASGLDKERPPQSLSGGQQQQLVIASAVAAGAQFLLLDEPLAQLDPPAAARTVSLLGSLAKRGCTVVVVEHRLAPFWETMDRLLVLDEGHIVMDDRPSNMDVSALVEMGVGVPSEVIFSALVGTVPQSPKPPLAVPARKAVPEEPHERDLLRLPPISHVYDGCEKPALDVPSIAIPQGTTVALLGENGSGKSTLLKCITGAIPSSINMAAGQVMGVPQDPDLSLFCETVSAELAFCPQEARMSKADVEHRVDQAAQRFALGPFLDRAPQALSRGQRGRVAIAAMTTGEPDILVLDEPTAGQNHSTISALMDAVVAKMSNGVLLFATHDIELALTCADRLIVLQMGSIVFDGSPATYCREFDGFTTPWIEKCKSMDVPVMSPETLLEWMQ